MKLVLIGGNAGSGKDTVASMLLLYVRKEYFGNKVCYSFAEPLKKIATNLFGWDGVKNDNGRRLIIFIGQYLGCELHETGRSYGNIKDIWSSWEEYVFSGSTRIMWDEELFNKDPYYILGDKKIPWIQIAHQLDTYFTKDKSFWVDIMIRKIESSKLDDVALVVIPDFRFKKEYYKLLINNYDIITVNVLRDSTKEINSKSELDLKNFKFDHIITNNSSFEDLREKVDELGKKLG